jgi:ectoine hydroxylase
MTTKQNEILSDLQVREYRRQGFVFQESLFSPQEMERICQEAELEYAEDSPRRIFEKDSELVRGVHGSHLYKDFFERLVRLPRLLGVAQQLLRDDAYIHQFKINAKRAFMGDLWPWHQDFLYWHREDGMPKPNALSVGVFLDDVTEFNGPLVLVPEAQNGTTIDVAQKGEGWTNTLTSDVKYTLDTNAFRSLVSRNGLVAPKGPKGSAVWFHCNTPHGSAPNISPFDRGLMLISYNSVRNAPSPDALTRPEWVAGQDFSPLEPAEDDLLR